MNVLRDWKKYVLLFRELFFAKTKRDICIGLSIGHSHVIAVEVERKAGEYKILQVVCREVSSDKMSKVELLKDIFHTTKFNTEYVNTSISGSSVIVRFITFPYMNKKDLRNSLEFEAENYIPFSLSDVNFDFHILGEKKTESKRVYSLALVAAKKELVDATYALCKDAGVKLVAIDVDCCASFNVFDFLYGEQEKRTVALVNIGGDLTTITIVCEGVPAFSRDLVFGGNDINKKLSKQKGLSLEETEEYKKKLDITDAAEKAIVKECLGYFLRELRLSFNFFKTQVVKEGANDVQAIYCLGGSSGLKGLCDIIHEEMNIDAKLFEPLKKFSIGEAVDLPLVERIERSLALPLGLAIRREP